MVSLFRWVWAAAIGGAMVSAAFAADATTQPVAANDPVWALLSDGHQTDAEAMLQQRIDANLKDEPAIFMLGVLTRSRFDVETGDKLLREAGNFDVKSTDCEVARAMTAIDRTGENRGDDADTAFARLQTLAKEHPETPAYTWLLAIACRTTQRNEEGVAAFAELSKQFKTGPVLFHQTYANMLDELKRYDQSLPHRKLAVSLEPASWAWQGLGDTYRRMQQWKDAIPAYQQAIKVNASDWRNFDRLCSCAEHAHDGNTEVATAKAYLAIKPNSPWPHVYLADGYTLTGDFNAAADTFVEAQKHWPKDVKLRAATVRALRKAGRNDEADQVAAGS